jgi:nucleoside diphosphate kinase
VSLFARVTSAFSTDGLRETGLVGEVIKRFEQKGYKLVNIKMVTPTADFGELTLPRCALFACD